VIFELMVNGFSQKYNLFHINLNSEDDLS